MSTRSGIVAGGNWIVDKLKTIDAYPQQDALANIVGETVGNGGSPFNVLVALSRVGATFPRRAVGLVGDDTEGRWVRTRCEEHGIGVADLRAHPTAPTSYTDVMTVRGTGRRTFFHQRGANAFLNGAQFDFTNAREKIFHLGYLLLLDALDAPDPEWGTAAAHVLHRARAAGLRTSVDLVSEDSQRFREIVLPALPQVDYCFLNEFELERTAGLPTRARDGGIDFGAVRTATERLMAAGVRGFVIVHFPEGACALARDGTFTARGSIRVPEGRIVSTVGAGDAFAAGVLLELHDEAPMEDALRTGIALAASCLLGAGTSDGILPRDGCLALERDFGCREIG